MLRRKVFSMFSVLAATPFAWLLGVKKADGGGLPLPIVDKRSLPTQHIVSKWLRAQVVLDQSGEVRIKIGKEPSQLAPSTIFVTIPKGYANGREIEELLRESGWIEHESQIPPLLFRRVG